jgi:cobyrinic acid a,c-diamide synthase
MGLFDGAGDGAGSTGALAAELGLPVVLVVDVRGQAASVAALVHGFRSYRVTVRVAGVICNRVGSAAHERLLKEALQESRAPTLGFLPTDPSLETPERHLGLVQAGERADLEAFLDRAAEFVGKHVDVHAVQRLARPAHLFRAAPPSPPLPPLGQRVAVARDVAFGFAYDGVLEGWRRLGAEIVPFSPLADEWPDPAADAVYLPGGYPELHAGRLAGARRFFGGLRHAAGRGATIYGECGGYMALGLGLEDSEGERHAMGGLLPLETTFARRRLSLGYREVQLAVDGPLGPAGTVYRGHEFHYAGVLKEDGVQPLFAVRDSVKQDLGPYGAIAGNVAGSFIHLIDRVGR